jgi:hypothetical protein
MTLETIATVIAIATAILGGLVWLIRAQVAVLREFKPNGGQSMRDQLNRIEARLDNHLDNHAKGSR